MVDRFHMSRTVSQNRTFTGNYTFAYNVGLNVRELTNISDNVDKIIVASVSKVLENTENIDTSRAFDCLHSTN